MKKVLYLVCALFMLTAFHTTTKAQSGGNYEGYLNTLDTLTNADTKTEEVTITGAKHCVSFQFNVTKISGTVAGTINIYPSLDGVTYSDVAAAAPITLGDSTSSYIMYFGLNAAKKYKVVYSTTGSQSCSVRTYLLYRAAK